MKQTAGSPRLKNLLRYLRLAGKHNHRCLMQRSAYKLP